MVGGAVVATSLLLYYVAGATAAPVGFGLVFIIMMGGRLAFAGSRHGEGFAELDGRCLYLRLGEWPWDHRYKWRDIDRVDVRPFAESGILARGIAPLLGACGRERVVILSLRKSLRSPWRPPFGTDTAGIPSIFVKQVLLSFENPDEFAAAARPFIQAGAP